MSSAFACSITLSMPAGGIAPGWENNTICSRNSITFGIERIWKCPASSCCSSVLILPNTTSGYFSDAASNAGANALQGPHHDAQKSSITMLFLVTMSSKLSLVISIVGTTLSDNEFEQF